MFKVESLSDYCMVYGDLLWWTVLTTCLRFLVAQSMLGEKVWIVIAKFK